MANELKLSGAIVLGSFASDPATGQNGEMYYNTTDNSFHVFANGAWTALAEASSVDLVGQALTDEHIIVGDGSNLSASVDTGAQGDILASGSGLTIKSGVITDSEINSAAAIALSKLAALSPNLALQSDGSGVISVSSVTNVELGYVSGVTSSIQTQLNALQPSGDYITALTGDVTASGPGSAAATLATVNTDVGSFGDSSNSVTFTVNGKGLVTAASASSITAPAGALTGSTLASNVTASSLTSLGTQAQALDMGNNYIVNVNDPANPQDAATKHYVDLQSSGVEWKDAVEAFADSNVPLTGGATLTIDGYSVQNGDSVILSNQTSSTQNGVYTASGIGTAYALTLRADSNPPSVAYAYLVLDGTNYQYSGWLVNAVSPTTFVQFTGPQELVFNAPLSRTGNDVNLGYGNGLTLSSSNLVVENADSSISVASGGIAVAPATGGALSVSSGLKVNVDGTSITVNGSNQLAVGDLSGTYAYVTLSNLGTTAINADLIPDGSETRNLGSATDAWNELYVSGLNEGIFGLLSIDVDNRALIDTNGSQQLAWGATGAASQPGIQLSLLTASTALALDASGVIVSSSTTDVELGYVHGVTSSIQTQLNGKQASGNYITALTGDVTASGPGSAAATIAAGAVTASKLGSVTDGITLDQSGAGSTLEVKAGGISNAQIGASAAIAYSKLAALNANVVPITNSSGFIESANIVPVPVLLTSGGLQRSDAGPFIMAGAVIEEVYHDAITLTHSGSVGAVQALQADYAGYEVAYVIEGGDGINVRMGTLRVVAALDGSSVASFTDVYTETASLGISWAVTFSGGYFAAIATNAMATDAIMRADVKLFRK